MAASVIGSGARMSFSTLIGLFASFALCAAAIVASANDVTLFVSGPSLILVIGGTMGCAFASYQAHSVLLALAELGRIVLAQRNMRRQLPIEVGRVVRWAYLVRGKGLKALEHEIKKQKTPDPFLVYGIDLVLAAYAADQVREMLVNAAQSRFERNTVPASVLRSMAATAPAFGMIGTLVGMVIMLNNLVEDPSQLGSGLAVALMTTLHGLLRARLVFLPAASRLQQTEEIERFRSYVVAEGLALLADQQNPRIMQDRLNSFLDPALHFQIDEAHNNHAPPGRSLPSHDRAPKGKAPARAKAPKAMEPA